MSEEAAMTDAQKRAAARKAKILARGNAGLAKLAQTARGEEAEMLYGVDSASSTRPGTPSQTSKPSATISSQNDQTSGIAGAKKPSWAPSTDASAGTAAPPRAGVNPNPQFNAGGMDPSADPFAQMMAMLQGGAGGAGGMGGGPEGMPDMSRLLAQMMGGTGGPGPEGGMPNLLGMGDLDDPAGLGGMPPLNPAGMPNFPDMSAFANMPGMGMAPQGKGWVEKLYPLIHFISVLALLAFSMVWWEPTIRAARWADKVDGQTVLGRWARLAGRGGVRQVAASGLLGSVEVLPIFWAFTTLQLILQTTRFFILKSPPAPHSMISTFLPLLPPAISRPVITGSRYLSMLSQVYKDGCLLIFGVGMMVVLAEYTQAWR